MHFKAEFVERLEYGVSVTHWLIVDAETDAVFLPACAWLYELHKQGKAVNTQSSYASHLKQLLDEAYNYFGVQNIYDFTDVQMSTYLTEILLIEKELEPSSFESHLAAYKSFFKFSFEQGFSGPQPYTYYVPVEHRYRLNRHTGRKKSLDPYKLHFQYHPEKEFRELLSFNPRKGAWFRARDEIVLKLGYLCGVRAAEIVNPLNFNVDNFLRAVKKADKSGQTDVLMWIVGKGNKPREINIPVALVRQIQRHIESDKSKSMGMKYIICKSDAGLLDAKFATELYKSCKENLLANAHPEIYDRWEDKVLRSFHSLRHTYATNLAYEIWCTKKYPRTILYDRMGHERSETTLVYLHFSSLVHGNVEKQNEFADEIMKTKRSFDNEE